RRRNRETAQREILRSAPLSPGTGRKDRPARSPPVAPRADGARRSGNAGRARIGGGTNSAAARGRGRGGIEREYAVRVGRRGQRAHGGGVLKGLTICGRRYR